MLKKEIKFTDPFGNNHNETWYFSLSKLELAERDIMADGGYARLLEKISQTGKASEVYPVMKDIILSAVGRQSDDGRRFLKTQDIIDDFVQCGAYETLIFDLLGDAKQASEFMNGLMPAGLIEEAQKISGTLEQPEAPKPKTVDDYTMTELTNMPYAEFEKLVKSANPGSLSREILVLAMQRRP